MTAFTDGLRQHANTLGCNGSQVATKDDLALALEIIADTYDAIDALVGLLRTARDAIAGLADQQAMPDNFYVPVLDQITRVVDQYPHTA